jgi:hypothetical protein
MVSLDGVMPLSPLLDTAGVLTRDPFLWQAAGKALYPGLKTFKKFPKKLSTIGFPNATDTGEANTIILGFLAKLESFLKVKALAIDPDKLWEKTMPSTAPKGVALAQYLNITYPILISKQQISLVRTPFYHDYGAKNGGRRPFVDPAPLIRWAFGDFFPAPTLDDEITKKTVFMSWWNTTVLIPDKETCSDSLVLYVGSTGEPNYRNQYGKYVPPRRQTCDVLNAEKKY